MNMHTGILQGSKKFEYLACLSDKQLSNVACPGQVIVAFLDLVGRQVAWALTHQAREDEK